MASRITGDQRVQSRVLEGLATAVNHRRWFVELALPHLGDEPIEIGSGLGDYAMAWAPRFRHFTATEADAERLVVLKERLAGLSSVTVRELLLPTEETASYTGAVSYNVLEHIEDHVGALRSMARLVRPGGAVVLIVPAFQFAMSPADVATGHVRRYTKATLGAAIEAAGGEVIATAALVDRSGGAVDFGVPFYPLVELSIPTYAEDEIPAELAALPVEKPGSRKD